MAARCAPVIRGINKPFVVELISSFAELLIAVVPIPTDPAVLILTRSALLVNSFRSMALVVPSFEALVALLLPAKLQ